MYNIFSPNVLSEFVCLGMLLQRHYVRGSLDLDPADLAGCTAYMSSSVI